MAGNLDFPGKKKEEIFHEVDLDPSDDENSGSIIETNEDGMPAPKYSYPRPYVPMTPQYIPQQGLARYNSALKHLIPVRKKKKKKKQLSIDEAGFFSLLTYSWMSKYIYLAYKKGLTLDDVPLCSPLDSSDLNAQRLERMWHCELALKGPNDASFGQVIWLFVRTRVFVSCITFAISCIMGFLSPTIFMRKLLEYSEDPEASNLDGVIWALALTTSELMRTLFFALCWSIGYRTATRVRAACLAMVYRKIIRLNSLGNKSIGELINLYANDGARLFNMIVFGPMIIGGPMVTVCGFVYIYYLLGGWALLGMITFLLFYPVQYGLSHLTGYYRGTTLLKSDERVRLVTEIMNSIKLIKMYAWENWFTTSVKNVRKKELKELEKSSYCNSISISMAPTVPVISGIITFLSHVLAGGNLTASQAFSTLVFLTKQAKTSIYAIRDASLSFYEGHISVVRLQAFTTTVVISIVFQLFQVLKDAVIAVPRGFKSVSKLQAFPLITILNTALRTAINNLRYAIENIIDCQITFTRLQELLLLEENVMHISHHIDRSLALCITDGSFAWGSIPVEHSKGKEHSLDREKEKLNANKQERLEVLQSINFSVSRASLVGVCGPVGSGKTSLLLACLGQLEMVSGQIFRSGRPAYVSQQAWIENASVKENIVFGQKFDAKRYINTLFCCALSDDINLLPGGDDTEIGERGVNLSGGQKQRISLARAMYSNRDIYFLDDPLSAVDTQVGSHIFEKCIMGALSKKTVVLVTHQIQFLQKCDEIIVIKEGKIVERGTHHELLSKGREYSFMVQSSTLQAQQKCTIGDVQDKEELTSPYMSPIKEQDSDQTKPAARKQLTTREEQLRGEVKMLAYHAYIKAAGGYIISFLVILAILLNVGSNAFSSWWLAHWIKAGSGNTSVFDPDLNTTVISTNINDNPHLEWYMRVYGFTIIIILFTSLLRGGFFTKVTIRASKNLHQNLYEKMICSPMRYFETTPIGRIQNLFSRDLDEVDSKLPNAVETMLQNIWVVMFSFLFITLVFPWFIIPLIVLAVLYFFITKIFRVAVRDLKRLDSISQAPIFSAVSATVQGLPTIHAFGKENDYISQFSKVFDENSTCMFLQYNAMRWMALRLDSISVSISCITALFVVILKGSVAPALAGLSLTYAAHISGVFQFLIRLMSETEARFISVERIQHNIEKLESEGNLKPEVNVPPEWPSKGAIKFQNVKLSYHKDLPEVLDGVSFTVKPGEKIGVVGRTGAGKSSLAVALFRMVEITSGKIMVDGVDIAAVALSILRSRLSVIPQDPVLFSGPLRANLDPFNKHKDEDLWDVLNKTKLSNKVKSMDGQLATLVGDGGDNLSVGERQLVCLARALLRGSKILVLDEATASVDPETEATVQATIEEEFRKCTVITIAHRLSTVTTSDRVLVMDNGMVMEYDSPTALLADTNSLFSKMSAAVGM